MDEPQLHYDDSFNWAVWRLVAHDIGAGLRKLPRLIMEGIPSLGVAYFLLARYGSEDAAWDLTIEKLFAIPIGLFIFCLMHLAWSWAIAPRRIYNKQQIVILSLTGELPKLSLKKASVKITGDRKRTADVSIVLNAVPRGRTHTFDSGKTSGTLLISHGDKMREKREIKLGWREEQRSDGTGGEKFKYRLAQPERITLTGAVQNIPDQADLKLEAEVFLGCDEQDGTLVRASIPFVQKSAELWVADAPWCEVTETKGQRT